MKINTEEIATNLVAVIEDEIVVSVHKLAKLVNDKSFCILDEQDEKELYVLIHDHISKLISDSMTP